MILLKKRKEATLCTNDWNDVYSHLNGRFLDELSLIFVLCNEPIFNLKKSLKQLFKNNNNH